MFFSSSMERFPLGCHYYPQSRQEGKVLVVFCVVIYTKLHVWIHWLWWLLEKQNFSLFCNLHSLSWRGSFSDAVDKQVQHTLIQIIVFLHIIYKTVNIIYLIYQKKYPLHIVLHELWGGPPMMLVTSCSSIPWLLICSVEPSNS